MKTKVSALILALFIIQFSNATKAIDNTANPDQPSCLNRPSENNGHCVTSTANGSQQYLCMSGGELNCYMN